MAAVENEQAAVVEAQLRPMQLLARRNAANLARLEQLHRQITTMEGLVEAKSNWVIFLADLQRRLASVEDVWLDQISAERPPTPSAANAALGPTLQLTLRGRLLDLRHPISKVSPNSYDRVKQLLTSFAGSPFVASVSHERFDNTQPGLLRFDCTLQINRHHPL